MTKKIFFCLLICGLITCEVNAQKMNIDTIAVAILDRMAAMIGDLSSCHVTVSSHYDIRSQHFGLVKHEDQEELYMQGPDKLLIRAEGDRGARSLYYNGNTLVYYSLENNHYAAFPLSAPIME
jgi:hypothetical protein